MRLLSLIKEALIMYLILVLKRVKTYMMIIWLNINLIKGNENKTRKRKHRL